jgi:phage-related protein
MAQPRTPLVFFKTDAGGEPVREWLKRLEKADRQAIGLDLQRPQFRWPAGMPLCRPLGQGLFEVRTNLTSNRIARVFVCHHDGELVALHGCIKKTRRTPRDDRELARKNMKKVEQS